MDIGVLAERIEEALTAQGARKRGLETRFRCVADGHEDRNPSARWNPEKRTWYCDACGVGGGAVDLARRLGIVVPVPRRRADAHSPVMLPARGRSDDLRRERRQRERAALAELRDAQSLVFVHGAIRRADPHLVQPALRAMYEDLGDPYLREHLAEERLDAIEAEDRDDRERGVRREAA